MQQQSKDPRERFISRVAAQRTFIDVGGLSNVIYERISAAHAAGASRVAMLDVEKPECEWWSQLEQRLYDRGINRCEFISADVTTCSIEKFDVVHSSGVLYHLPSPITYVRKLREMTGEYCILTSTTMHTEIEGLGQSLKIPDGTVIFVPALADTHAGIVRDWFARHGFGDVTNSEVTFGGYKNLENYYPNWFIPTVAAFRTMATCCGFEIVDEADVYANCAHTLLLRPA
jgi:hypothetical protein